MSETLCTTKRAIAIVSCVWFGAGAKDAKSLLEQTLGFVRREEIVALANHVTVTIEADGSGKVLLPQLQVRLNTPVSGLMQQIVDVLCNTHNHLNSWTQIRLFQGHGGPELFAHHESLKCDSLLVLAERTIKTGIFFRNDSPKVIRAVYVASEWVVLTTGKHTNIWDRTIGEQAEAWNLKTGLCCWVKKAVVPFAVSEEFIALEHDSRGCDLLICSIRHGRKVFSVRGGCSCATFSPDGSRLAVASQCCRDVRLVDTINRCVLWTRGNLRFHVANIRISRNSQYVTVERQNGIRLVGSHLHGTRYVVTRVRQYFSNLKHEKFCDVFQPKHTATLVNNNCNILVSRVTLRVNWTF